MAESKRLLVVATAGAGGDLQPLIATALALRERGWDATFVGDRSVQETLAPLGLTTVPLASGLDLGPRLIAAVREAIAAGDDERGAEIVATRLAEWAAEVAVPVGALIRPRYPSVVVTSLFGVEAVALARPRCPWVVINSTFYLGPDSPRPLALDVSPRALPLLARYAGLLGAPDLVLHATDGAFDFGFTGLPARHHYVGPLGIWEPALPVPDELDQPGPPWVLVSLSSQAQDDLPLAEAALAALGELPVRAVVTLGPGHEVAGLEAPPNVRLTQQVSHRAVLEHGRLLVSHAGHGAVLKALWVGRPMVLVPWGRDQPGVAARAEALGVARVVPRASLSDTVLATAIRATLADHTMAEVAASHAARLRQTDPPDLAASLITKLV
jgi:UDP:flavonoid glycosyltransferase YjiC (YdhE family)